MMTSNNEHSFTVWSWMMIRQPDHSTTLEGREQSWPLFLVPHWSSSLHYTTQQEQICHTTQQGETRNCKLSSTFTQPSPGRHKVQWECMSLIQLDVGSFIICLLPGGFVQRQANTSLHVPRPPKHNLKWNQRPEPAWLKKKTSNRELIISVNNRLLSEKTSSAWFFSLDCLSLWKNSLLCEVASEIPTCESLSWWLKPH